MNSFVSLFLVQEPDELVAMGTNWAPPPMNLSRLTGSTRTSSFTTQGQVGPVATVSSHNGSASTSHNAMYGIRRINKVATMPHISAMSSRTGFKDQKSKGKELLQRKHI